jgi:cold shock CspA family protein
MGRLLFVPKSDIFGFGFIDLAAQTANFIVHYKVLQRQNNSF